MTEKDIVYEAGQYWVAKSLGHWMAYKNGVTHAKSVGAWDLDENGLSIAIAYAAYMGGCKLTAQQATALAKEHYQGAANGKPRNQQHGRSGVSHGGRTQTCSMSIC